MAILWARSEWHSDPNAVFAYHDGYEADVYPERHADGRQDYFWIVRPASREWPAVIDCGFTPTLLGGLRAAEQCLIHTTTKEH